MNVGTRFTKKAARRYTTASGEKGTHSYELLCEITSTSGVGFEWVRVEVLAEDGRPADFDAFVPTSGSTAWFGWDAALGRGDVRVVA